MGWRSEGQVSRAGHLEFGILGGGLRKTEEMNKDSTFGTGEGSCSCYTPVTLGLRNSLK